MDVGIEDGWIGGVFALLVIQVMAEENYLELVKVQQLHHLQQHQVGIVFEF